MKSSSAEWLANLPEYDCIRCNFKTIFKGLCSDCDSYDYNMERIAELQSEIERSHKEMLDISMLVLSKQDELAELKRLVELK